MQVHETVRKPTETGVALLWAMIHSRLVDMDAVNRDDGCLIFLLDIHVVGPPAGFGFGINQLAGCLAIIGGFYVFHVCQRGEGSKRAALRVEAVYMLVGADQQFVVVDDA